MDERPTEAVSRHDEAARALISRAVRAPSSHNTQPWRFRIDRDGVGIHLDPERRLPVNDPDDRELVISCGCALMNLRVAAAAAGRGYRLETLPEGDRSTCLARLTWRDSPADAEEAGLAPGIEHRRTVRQRFTLSAVPDDDVDALAAMAAVEGATLQVIDPGEVRRGVADLVAEGDALQWRDARWRRELAGWMRPPQRSDGLAVPRVALPFARAAVTRFDLGARVGRHDRELAEQAPRLLALGTEGDTRADRLRAGQALERMLLAASQLGLQASYLNQPIQVASLRRRLQETLGACGHPQILLRLGYPRGHRACASRRPIAEVIAPATD